MNRFLYRALVVALAAVCPRLSWSQPHARTPEEYDKRDRRIEIQAQKPGKGIKTGLVIAYGHRISPPYKVESKAGKLYVNGVQVKPSLIDEREQQANPVPVLDPKAQAINDSLWQTETKLQDMARKGISREKIIAFAKGQLYIKDVKVGPSGELILTEEGSPLPMHVMLPEAGSTLPSDAERKSRAMSAQRNDVFNVELKLKRGDCVIFVDGGTSEQHLTAKFPAIIPKIMDDSSLSSEEKLRRLSAVIVDPAARDILANYSRSEWTEKQ